MKERAYDFSRRVRSGPKVTKQEIIDSLTAFARERGAESFTQKAYDAWPKRVLCASQINVRFGGWAKAMERAGLAPQWNFSKDPTEMVELFLDCWEENDDCPTEKVFQKYLLKHDSKYGVQHYKRYFGGIRRLSKRVVEFHAKRISEKQLLERWERPRRRRGPIAPSLRFEVLKRDNHKCVVCGRSAKDGVTLEVDHIVPVASGGTDVLSNLQTLCERCNKGKGARA